MLRQFGRHRPPSARFWATVLTGVTLVVSCSSPPTNHWAHSAPALPLEKLTRAGGRLTIYWTKRSVAHQSNGRPLPYQKGRRVLTGLDQMVLSRFGLLKGRRVALLANDTSRDSRLRHILPVMRAYGAEPVLVLEPEHGFYGDMDQEGRIGVRRTGKMRILSLYSKKYRKPRPEHLAGVDLILVDIQNLPVRCYTYITTLTRLMEAAEEGGIEMLILDRPNPYGMWSAAGPYLRREYRSFIATAPTPFLYSLSLGEYALFMARTRFRRLRLGVMRTRGFKRKAVGTLLEGAWINPSPNIPSLEAALVYPGMVMFEGVNLSIGRGTTRPFVYSGAPWLKSAQIVRELRALRLPGVKFAEVRFRPTTAPYRNQLCRGIRVLPVSMDFDPVRTAYEYLRIVMRIHPVRLRYVMFRQHHKMDLLWGGPGYRAAVEGDVTWDRFRGSWIAQAQDFEKRVRGDRIY